MAKYMIHTCNGRLKYVENYLIPAMTKQGIQWSDITIWLDADNEGNLISCMKSFRSLFGSGCTWHLQDDVIISPDFKEITEQSKSGVICGFCNSYSEDMPSGYVSVWNMWYSFPCIQIPDRIARECADWFYTHVMLAHDAKYDRWIKENKFDDSFFREFMLQNHTNDVTILNLNPNIVEHVDYLIGGSILNPYRQKRAGSMYWEHNDVVKELADKIKADGILK